MNAQQVICTSAEARRYTISGSDGMKFTWHVPKEGNVLHADTLNDTIYIVWQKKGEFTLTVDGDYNGCTVSKKLDVTVKQSPIVESWTGHTFL